MRVSETRVLLLLLSTVQCLCDCPLPPSGSKSCSDTKPPDNIPNIQGAPPSDGSCEFRSSFCNYSQGCRDPGANDWTLPGLYAEVQGRNDVAPQYSVLQSPLLRIDQVTCFRFSASVANPSRLAVYFGEELENSCTVISEVAPGVTVTLNENVNFRPATGKIFFRGKSGGAAFGYVRLYSVSLTTGRCEDPQCSFDNAYNDRACDHWEWNGWNVVQVTDSATGSKGNVSALGPGLPAGTLKTDLLMATGNQTACLQFHYRMTGINDTLAVSVQHKDGRTELMWQVTNHDEASSWPHATLPLFSDSAFFINFQGQRCHTLESTDIAIDNVKVLRPSSCDHVPQGSKPSSQQLTSTQGSKPSSQQLTSTLGPRCDLPKTTTSAQLTQSEISTTTSAASDSTTQMSDNSSLNDTGSTEEYNTIPAIVGAVAGVVVLAVAGVVIAIVTWRMRKTKRSGLKNKELSQSSGGGYGAKNNSEPSGETAAAPGIPSATETHYEGLGELSPQSHYTALVGTESALHVASYYNIESTTQAGRHGPHKTSTAETQYERFGEPSPPSVYTTLQNTAAASDTGAYYSNDVPQDNRSYNNVAPGNSAYYNVLKDPQNAKT